MYSIKEVTDLVRETFYGKKKAYGEGFFIKGKNKVAYPTARDADGKDLPLTSDVVFRHLKGELYIGIYPLVETSKTKWLAMDFDGDGGEDPLQMALQQQSEFYEVGIISYVEISRSGNGAHVWIFLDELIEARVIRAVAKNYLIEAETFDRMFPNQDSDQGSYGNLIALPYQGSDYKKGNSLFLDEDGSTPLPLREFLKQVKPNRASFIQTLYEEELPDIKDMVAGTTRTVPRQSLSGALKVTTFSNWMKAARTRMPMSNQEPEFYALCCQFAQLEDGERLAYEFGRLHPYSDSRIAQKFEQAKLVNKPHSCKTLREEFGWEETADLDHGVTFPFELANKPFKELMAARRGSSSSWKDIGLAVIDQTKEIFKTDERYGWAYGYDKLDDLSELRKGNLLILGARTKVGKTSMAVDITHNLNMQDIPVYWASLEMTKEELGLKYLSNIAEVDSNHLRKGTLTYKEWRKVLGGYKTYQDLQLYIDDETNSLERMIDVTAGLVAEHGPGLLVVDYIELIAPMPGESMFSLTNRVIVDLKALAKVLDIPILALSNFNRKAEQDMVEDIDPMDGWLRNSGLCEQTADVILYLLGRDTNAAIQERKIRIQKERHSGAGGSEIEVWFEGSISKFHSHPPQGAYRGIDLGNLVNNQFKAL